MHKNGVKKVDSPFFFHWNCKSNILYSQDATLTSEIKRQHKSGPVNYVPILCFQAYGKKIRKCKQEACRG
jgi:hypothetical protein